MSEEKNMHTYQCQMQNCGFMYSPKHGDRKNKIPKGVPFSELPDTYKCPLCGANKSAFLELDY